MSLVDPPSEAIPSRAELRRLLDVLLPGDNDLNGFVYDHFPSVLQRFQRIDNETTLLDEAQCVPASAGITSWQSPSIATYVPPHVQEVTFSAQLENYSVGARALYLTFDGDAPASPRGVYTSAGAYNGELISVFMASQVFRWKTDSNVLDHTVRISVRKWRD